ncbi:hypothetical protein [Methylacidimicrobium sp. B4]|uniref:hypothetical protein n=1 Tax=Methylacidimicrobium sp. B4 TaxID=2796139 RepID=UPI001A8C2614|nr:hypothetical protein [Methylacidimicrobium sp. B4]QSR84984.1 hypothetical protein MacB4_01560 [Methylacidimicrobium sp. B4]
MASRSAARKISCVRYSQTIALLKLGCFRAGVEGIEVDPAYPSGIGGVNHARRHGIAFHQGAAAIAWERIGPLPSVRPCGRWLRRLAMAAISPSPYPRGIGRSLSGRSGRRFGAGSTRRRQRMPGRATCEEPPARLLPETRAWGATWALLAESRHANRREHSSAEVVDDLPW